MTAYLRESWAVGRRWLIRLRREPMALAFSLFQPILWLLLFGNLFRRMLSSLPQVGGDYLAFMSAGVIVMTAVGGSLSGGVPLLFDKETGMLHRLLVTPARRSALIVGRLSSVVLVALLQSLLILLGVMVLGVRPATGLAGIGAILGVIVLFCLGVGVLSLALAFVLRGHGSFFALTNFLSLPLIFLSSALAPLDVMPLWLQALARLNPLTYAIEAIRTLILHGWAWGSLAWTLAGLLLFDLIALAVSVRIFARGMREA